MHSVKKTCLVLFDRNELFTDRLYPDLLKILDIYIIAIILYTKKEIKTMARYKFYYTDNYDRGKFLTVGGVFCLFAACFFPAVTLLNGESLTEMDDTMRGITFFIFCFAVVFLASGIWLMIKNWSSSSRTADNGGFGCSLLGFFLPPVGLVLYLISRKRKPKTAKAYGIGTLIGVVYYVYTILAA